MNRTVTRVIRFFPKVILSALLAGIIIGLLSNHVKIEVTTLRETKIISNILQERAAVTKILETTTLPSTTRKTTSVTTATAPITMTTEYEDPRISFDKIINPHPFQYIRVPKNICKSEAPTLLILVKSNVFQIGHRMAIRSTWGNFTNDTSTELAFLLGDSSLVKEFTAMEFDMYNDIIQEDFIDEYKNNTLKTIMGFNWAAKYCSGSKFVLFVDDDYFVNISILNDLIKNVSMNMTSSFIGHKYDYGVVRRNKESKWYVPKEEWPDKLWPPYISGGSMLLTMDVVKSMTKAFPHVRPVFIDDVYLGIVAKALNITLTNDKRFEVKFLPEKFDSLIASHDFGSPHVLINEWNQQEDDIKKK